MSIKTVPDLEAFWAQELGESVEIIPVGWNEWPSAGFRRSEVPEPSANHAYRGNRSQDTCWVEVGGEMCRKPVEAHTEPQGEPSGAQVEVALNARTTA